MGFEVFGVREWAADLRSSSGRVGAAASLAVRKTAADVERDAKINAPVDTGALKNSIGTTLTGDGRHGSMTATIGPTVNYGIFVELGTSKMGAQPYLFPAADRHAPTFLAALAQIRDTI